MSSVPPHPVHGRSLRILPAVVVLGLLLDAATTAPAQSVVSNYVFTHLAGPLGGYGNADGTGPAARFNWPEGMAADRAGNLYVADTFNHTIRKISPAGVVTTLAGVAGVPGSEDGAAPVAHFNFPEGVAVDNAGNLYVADTSNHIIRKITAGGAVTTLAGTTGQSGSSDGTGTAASFYFPSGLAIDSAGTVYVADNDNHTIRKITPAGVVTTLAGTAGQSGKADGTGAAAQFYFPRSVGVDGAGNVYVTDSGNRIIRRITSAGVVTTLAGEAGQGGVVDGTGAAARFGAPWNLAVDSAGTVYVADAGSTVRKVSPVGVVTTLAGIVGNYGTADGTGAAAQFGNLTGVAVDNAGTIYGADSSNQTIRRISPAGVVTTFAGAAGRAGAVDGTGADARFSSPFGVAVDSTGTVYVGDQDNHTIRKITPAGVVTTFAGTAGAGGYADGTGADAQFSLPLGLAIDSSGNLYVADAATTIRKVTPAGVVTTLAGTPGPIHLGSADGTGAAAQFNHPAGVAVDRSGNVFVADWWNDTIRKITPAGVVTTFAGSAGIWGSADGVGTAALFIYPYGVAIDSADNLYVTDSGNYTIRKITPAGVVTTLAGTPGKPGSADGTGPAAQFFLPRGIVADGAGNVYVADNYNQTIRKITPAGIVTTVGGTVGVRSSADGYGPVALFNSPGGLAIDRSGNLYVADTDNHAIRKGQLAGPPVITTQPLGQTVAPGGSVQFSVSASSLIAPTYQWYVNGSSFSGATGSSLSFTNARSTDAGDYTVVVTNPLGSVLSSTATLTVAAAPVTPPATPAATGGGGSMGGWFALALLALGAVRFAHGRR